jgi:hypothetical protein
MPENCCRPKIANTTDKNMRKTVAFPNSGSDFSKILTYLLILGLAFKLLKGLMTLRILNAFRFKSTAMNSSILYNQI